VRLNSGLLPIKLLERSPGFAADVARLRLCGYSICLHNSSQNRANQITVVDR
jgi:hypothetical protein